jgi:hypothetical protein
MSFSFDSHAPGQRRYTLYQRLCESVDRKLCALSDWADSWSFGTLGCCGSDTHWDLVDSERRFTAAVTEERGVVYGSGNSTNLELALRYHRNEVGYSLSATDEDSEDCVEYAQDVGGRAEHGSVVVYDHDTAVARVMASVVTHTNGVNTPSPARNTSWRNLRRRRFALSPSIVVAIADELTVKIGRMCATCGHENVREVQLLCAANYRSAEFAYLNIAEKHGLHPQHVRLYLEPTLIEYFSDRGTALGFGAYTGLLSNAERRRGTGGGRH